MSQPLVSLGISVGPRSGAAVLMHPKGVVAAATEERGPGRRSFLPLEAVQYCLAEAGLKDLSAVDIISLQSRHARDWTDFLANQFAEEKSWIESLLSLPTNIRNEMRFRAELRRELERVGTGSAQLPEVVLVADDQAIAQGLFSVQPAPELGVVVLDAPFTEMATGFWMAKDGRLESVWRQVYPQSLELLVANLAGFCGFRGRMGQRQFFQLAEYGEDRFVEMVRAELLTSLPDGSFRLNLDALALEPNRESDWTGLRALLQDEPRRPEQPISSREIDLAHALLTVVGEWIQHFARVARENLGTKQLLVRGQGPLFDRVKAVWRRLEQSVRLVGLSDETLVMAAGAALEALVAEGVKMDQVQALNLRPAAAFREYGKRVTTTALR